MRGPHTSANSLAATFGLMLLLLLLVYVRLLLLFLLLSLFVTIVIFCACTPARRVPSARERLGVRRWNTLESFKVPHLGIYIRAARLKPFESFFEIRFALLRGTPLLT